jgi:hypothetical protein
MKTVLIWKKACIDLFIIYFNIELKRTNLTSHTDTKLMDMRTVIIPRPILTLRLKALWPISVSLDDSSLDMEKGMH